MHTAAACDLSLDMNAKLDNLSGGSALLWLKAAKRGLTQKPGKGGKVRNLACIPWAMTTHVSHGI